jgi:hypothetical protein
VIPPSARHQRAPCTGSSTSRTAPLLAVLAPGEALLLGGGHGATVDDESGGGVVEHALTPSTATTRLLYPAPSRSCREVRVTAVAKCRSSTPFVENRHTGEVGPGVGRSKSPRRPRDSEATGTGRWFKLVFGLLRM